MFARLRVTHGVPKKVGEGVRQFRDNVVPSSHNVPRPDRSTGSLTARCSEAL